MGAFTATLVRAGSQRCHANACATQPVLTRGEATWVKRRTQAGSCNACVAMETLRVYSQRCRGEPVPEAMSMFLPCEMNVIREAHTP